MLLLLFLLQCKHVKIQFKVFLLFYHPVHKPSTTHTLFSKRKYTVMDLNNMHNFMAFKECISDLEHTHTDRQTESLNNFEL